MSATHSRYARKSVALAVAAGLAVGSLTLAPAASAKAIKPDFFAMHDSQIANGSTPGVKTGAARLWDTGTAWRQIETTPGVFDWSKVDAAVAKARGAGLKPMLVLGQTPQFHAQEPLAPGAYGDGATSMPDIKAWRGYVTKAAKRYGTKVEYQVWNEPNVVNYWTGSVQDMAKLTAVAGKAITKAAGRKATVVAPAFPLRLEGQRRWYQKYWSAKVGGKGMSAFVDVVSANLYPLADQGPEASMKLLSFAKRVLPKAAKRKPVWNTEINYGLLGGPTAKEISEAKQASFVARTLLLNAASPVRRVYWYAWDIGPIANTHLVESDRSTLTKAGRAWGEVRRWLVGSDVKGCSKVRGGKLKGLYTCTAKKSANEVRRFYWKPTGAAKKIRTARSTYEWTNLSGKTTKRTGRFQIKVGKSPVMVVSKR